MVCTTLGLQTQFPCCNRASFSRHLTYYRKLASKSTGSRLVMQGNSGTYHGLQEHMQVVVELFSILNATNNRLLWISITINCHGTLVGTAYRPSLVGVYEILDVVSNCITSVYNYDSIARMESST